ncbi:MAG: methyl-accepting chemotaxis protein [Calditerrivibrio sp.]|nr:methyl-accepting chemotaxis protein [Calditerrivibrio sp.]
MLCKKLKSRSLFFNMIIVSLIIIFLVGGIYHSSYLLKKQKDLLSEGKDLIADILPPPLYIVEPFLIVTLMKDFGQTEQNYIKKMEELKKDYDSRVQYWEKSTIDMGLKNSLLGEQRVYADKFWHDYFSKFLPLFKKNDINGMNEIFKELHGYYQKHRSAVEKTVSLGNSFADARIISFDNVYKRSMFVNSILLVISIFIIAFMIFPTIKNIYRGIDEVRNFMQSMTKGDLTKEAKYNVNNEILLIVYELMNMKKSLHEIISNLKSSSLILNTTSDNVVSLIKQSNEIITEQNDLVNQLSSNADEMNQTIQAIAINAKDINSYSQNTLNISADGKKIVEKTMDEVKFIATVIEDLSKSVQHLENKSKQIEDISNVIRDIAEQTNLLALNAAIEAARAGENGRGFAVVADEVRKLAEKTRSSTTEIDKMIKDIKKEIDNFMIKINNSVNKVNTGVELSNNAIVSLRSIVQEMSMLKENISQVAVSLDQMRTASSEITNEVAILVEKSDNIKSVSDEVLNIIKALEDISNSFTNISKRFVLG